MEIEIKFEDLNEEVREELIKDLKERFMEILKDKAFEKDLDLDEFVYNYIEYFQKIYEWEEFKKNWEQYLDWYLEDKAEEVLGREFKTGIYIDYDEYDIFD